MRDSARRRLRKPCARMALSASLARARRSHSAPAQHISPNLSAPCASPSLCAATALGPDHARALWLWPTPPVPPPPQPREQGPRGPDCLVLDQVPGDGRKEGQEEGAARGDPQEPAPRQGKPRGAAAARGGRRSDRLVSRLDGGGSERLPRVGGRPPSRGVRTSVPRGTCLSRVVCPAMTAMRNWPRAAHCCARPVVRGWPPAGAGTGDRDLPPESTPERVDGGGWSTASSLTSQSLTSRHAAPCRQPWPGRITNTMYTKRNKRHTLREN